MFFKGLSKSIENFTRDSRLPIFFSLPGMFISEAERGSGRASK